MIKLADYGLTEKMINVHYYEALGNIGKKIYLEGISTMRNKATHLIDYIDRNGNEKETFAVEAENGIENMINLLEGNGFKVLAVSKKE